MCAKITTHKLEMKKKKETWSIFFVRWKISKLFFTHKHSHSQPQNWQLKMFRIVLRLIYFYYENFFYSIFYSDNIVGVILSEVCGWFCLNDSFENWSTFRFSTKLIKHMAINFNNRAEFELRTILDMKMNIILKNAFNCNDKFHCLYWNGFWLNGHLADTSCNM